MTESKANFTLQELCSLGSGTAPAHVNIWPNASGELTLYGKDGKLYLIINRYMLEESPEYEEAYSLALGEANRGEAFMVEIPSGTKDVPTYVKTQIKQGNALDMTNQEVLQFLDDNACLVLLSPNTS